MKKVLFSMLAVAGIAIGSASASAQYFGPFSASATPSSATPGGSVTVTVQNCDDGTSVTITLEESSVTVTCSDEAPPVQGFRAPAQTPTPGTASGDVTAPTTPGSYTGTATGTSDGDVASADFEVSVEAATSTTPGVVADLPATGGGGAEPLAIAAVVLLVAGLGLVVVTQVRRRSGRVTT